MMKGNWKSADIEEFIQLLKDAAQIIDDNVTDRGSIDEGWKSLELQDMIFRLQSIALAIERGQLGLFSPKTI